MFFRFARVGVHLSRQTSRRMDSMNPLRLLELASVLSRTKEDGRTYFIGAVGLRADGKLVGSYNGNPKTPNRLHHAEYRLSRKLTSNSLVFVSRTLACGSWAMAKPCPDCESRLLNIGVSRVYYTIEPNHYGVLIL